MTDSNPSTSKRPKRKAPQKSPPKPKQTKKILIAENDPDQAFITKVILEVEGYNCTLATTGTQAVALVGTVMPDLIITGIGLLEIDGLKAAELIRNDPKTSSIPILVVSAKYLYEDWPPTPRPYNDYLQKPITSSQLISSVERLIR